MIEIWQVGNTGVRNPLRIQDALRVYSESNLVGKIRGVEASVAFMTLLCEKGVLNNVPGKDITGSYGRKWRLVFNLNGFTYHEVDQKEGISQEEIGNPDEISPFGRVFLRADTVPAIQECFLRAMSMKMKPLGEGKFFSPLLWTLFVLLELEKVTGEAAVDFIEFSLIIQTTDPSFDLSQVVSEILVLRERRKNSSSKKKFDSATIEHYGIDYPKKKENFFEYGDMNLRYLRATGILQRKGKGIAIVPEKHKLAVELAKIQITEDGALQRYKELYNGPKLPTDDIILAKEILSDLYIQLSKKRLSYHMPLNSLQTAAELNNARHAIEALLSEHKELEYASDQRDQWREICDFMELISKNRDRKKYDDDNEIIVPKAEKAAYLEWIIWRAFLAIDSLVNTPSEARRFRIDHEFFPVSTAPGNGPDLIAEFTDYVLVIEVTLTTSSRQEAMEGETVRRHVADLIEKYDKPVYGLFIAIDINSNTAETFRRGIWYTSDDSKLNLRIVPFTLDQFRNIFRSLFIKDKVEPFAVIKIIEECEKYRAECEAPEWKRKISSVVTRSFAGITD